MENVSAAETILKGSSRVIVKKSKAIHFLRDKADLI
jgi:hypothetical protein